MWGASSDKGRGWLLQKNEDERAKAGEEEDRTQKEHTRLLQWSNTITSANEALTKAAKDLLDLNQALASSAKASMIAEGLPESLVKDLPVAAWVSVDQRMEAWADILRVMESFRDVSCSPITMLIIACLLQLWLCHAAGTSEQSQAVKLVQSWTAHIICWR